MIKSEGAGGIQELQGHGNIWFIFPASQNNIRVWGKDCSCLPDLFFPNCIFFHGLYQGAFFYLHQNHPILLAQSDLKDDAWQLMRFSVLSILNCPSGHGHRYVQSHREIIITSSSMCCCCHAWKANHIFEGWGQQVGGRRITSTLTSCLSK